MEALAREYPQHDFYVIGRMTWKKDEAMPSNLINVIGEYSLEFDKTMTQIVMDEHPRVYQECVIEYLKKKNVKIDFGILHFGSTFGCSTFENRKTKKNEWMKTTCAAKNYQGMIMETLNQLKFPWLGIVTDPRQLKSMQDLYNYPVVLLSQIDEDWKFDVTIWKNGKSHEETKIIPQVYAGVEKTSFMMFDHINQIETKDTLFGMIQNEGVKRGPILEDFGILGRDNVKIYGKWSDAWIKKYPKNLVGMIRPDEINDKIKGWKYTFCVPIGPGWITLKYDEMLHNGVFPFLHESYASKVKDHGIDPYFFVKNKQELWEKIDFLEKNPSTYYSFMFNARKRLTGEMYNGKFITNKIEEAVKKYLNKEM